MTTTNKSRSGNLRFIIISILIIAIIYIAYKLYYQPTCKYQDLPVPITEANYTNTLSILKDNTLAFFQCSGTYSDAGFPPFPSYNELPSTSQYLPGLTKPLSPPNCPPPYCYTDKMLRFVSDDPSSTIRIEYPANTYGNVITYKFIPIGQSGFFRVDYDLNSTPANEVSAKLVFTYNGNTYTRTGKL